MRKKLPPTKLGPQTRVFTLRTDDTQFDADARTMRVSFSSETPCNMWYGREILDHSKSSIRLDSARQQNMPLLFNHKMDDLLGTVENVQLDGKRCTATIRFGKDSRGDWAMQQASDGILRNTSFMYRVYRYEEDDEDEEDEPTYRATDWEPYEISLVTVPADASVGVGRNDKSTENPVTFITKRSLHIEVNMSESSSAAPAAQSGASAGGTANVDMDALRTQALREVQETERVRLQKISDIAVRHELGGEFVEHHRSRNSSLDQVRDDALDRVANLRRNEDAVRAAEDTRKQEIEALAKRHKLPEDFVKQHVLGKTSIETVRGLALEHISVRSGPAEPLSRPGVDWTASESQRYSLSRAIMAQLTGDWSKAGFEREVSNTMEKERGLKGNGGFFMPSNMPFQVKGAQRSHMLDGLQSRATYQVGTASQGGNLVETQLLAADFIEVLRNQTVTGQLGARYLTGLTGNVNIPRQATQTQTYWVGESVAVTESEATFDQVQLRPKTVGALSKMSRLSLMQTTPAIEQLVREDLLAVGALAVDAAALYGTGTSSQPTGITNTTGVGAVSAGTNGGNATFDLMVSLYATPLIANAPQANLAYAINAKLKGYLATLKSTTGQYLWSPTQSIAGGIQSELVGYKYALSNQLPYNLVTGSSGAACSMAIFGNWLELLIAEWGVTEIMASPYDATGFTNGDVLIRMFQTIDVGLRHPASFAVSTSLLTPGF